MNFLSKNVFKNNQGFTLVEMLTVIFIILLLAGLLTPALGKAREKAREAKCKHNLKQIGNLIALYEIDSNTWPNNLTTLLSNSDIESETQTLLQVCPQAEYEGQAAPHYEVSNFQVSHTSGKHSFRLNKDFAVVG